MTPLRQRMIDDMQLTSFAETGRLHPDCTLDRDWPPREAMRALGVSRQTVLQRVKRGELEAIHVMRGKQKGLRIKVIQQHPNLCDYSS